METCCRCTEAIERDREAFYVTATGAVLCRACDFDCYMEGQGEPGTVRVDAGELAPYEDRRRVKRAA